MSVAAMSFLYLAVATSGGALAFLTGQRVSGRTPKEVERCYEHASRLESVVKDLRALDEDAANAELDDAARDELRRAREELEDAVHELRRGADLVV